MSPYMTWHLISKKKLRREQLKFIISSAFKNSWGPRIEQYNKKTYTTPKMHVICLWDYVFTVLPVNITVLFSSETPRLNTYR